MASADRGEGRFTRRDLLSLAGGALVVAAVPLAAWRRAAVVRRAVPVMDTIAEFTVVHARPAEAQAAIDAAVEELRRVDRTMTMFSDASEIGRVNRSAAGQPVPVSAGTRAVVAEALAWAAASEGRFDPGIGRVSGLWDVTRRQTPPPQRAFERLAGRNLYRAIELEVWRGEPAVRFADRDVALDLGGVAKGWAVDRAAEALRRHGVTQAIVNVGGDLYALGRSPEGGPWHVGIQSPEDPSRLAGEVAVEDGAVATSGDYLRYFAYQGRRYHHLLDPETAAPRQTPVHSVTVSAATCCAADAAATAVYGMPEDHAARLLAARAPAARVVRVIAGEA